MSTNKDPNQGHPQNESLKSQQPDELPQPGVIPQAKGLIPQPEGYPQQGVYLQTTCYPQRIHSPPGFPRLGSSPEYAIQSNAYSARCGESAGFATQDELGEDDDLNAFDFTNQSIRKAFIKKVYAILMCQLLVTMSFIALFLFHEPTKNWVRTYGMLLLGVAVVLLFVSLIPMVLCRSVRRTFPTNFIFLSIFTVAESFLLGVITSTYDVSSVMMAVGITAAICLSLTIFAIQTKYDFTVMGGALLSISVVLLLFGIICIFIPHDKIVTLVYSSLCALLFSFYFVYDTHLMMGGKHKYSISPEEYIFAALNLYLDVINILLHILRLLKK